MNKLLIIDGNAMVHRAFHAYPPSLTLPDGKLVNAVYGFFSIMIKAIEEVKPEYLLICFDRRAPTFRKQLYAGYQAHRPQMADGLSEQISLLHEALEEIGIPLFEIDGYEADDLIGTISKQAKEKGVESIILSGDRDLLQLVNTHVKMLAPIVGITKFTLFDEQTVLEKYGVKPSQVTDYKALIGDSSDGYPGVNGIGPKTAQNLLLEYESFENIYQHLGEIPEKTMTKLATDAEQAALAKKLATIALDAPVHLNLSACSLDLFTRGKFEKVCDTYGFHSLKKRLGSFANTDYAEKSTKAQIESEKKKQLELL